jgi:hypothetical protein
MFANIVDLHLSQSNPNGTCVKASLDGSGSAVWKITDCSDLSSKGFVCQTNQVMEEIGEGKKHLILTIDCKMKFQNVNISFMLEFPKMVGFSI